MPLGFVGLSQVKLDSFRQNSCRDRKEDYVIVEKERRRWKLVASAKPYLCLSWFFWYSMVFSLFFFCEKAFPRTKSNSQMTRPVTFSMTRLQQVVFSLSVMFVLYLHWVKLPVFVEAGAQTGSASSCCTVSWPDPGRKPYCHIDILWCLIMIGSSHMILCKLAEFQSQLLILDVAWPPMD